MSALQTRLVARLLAVLSRCRWPRVRTATVQPRGSLSLSRWRRKALLASSALLHQSPSLRLLSCCRYRIVLAGFEYVRGMVDIAARAWKMAVHGVSRYCYAPSSTPAFPCTCIFFVSSLCPISGR